ncbi:MAG: hypothetical protein U5N85_08405 [Arcicella sp.]|nr:hypothetical protein [Arcicella sp.]
MLSEAQTISAPIGQPIAITNSIDVMGDINMGVSNSIKLGGKFLSSSSAGGATYIGLGAGAVSAGCFQCFRGGNSGLLNTISSSNFFMGYASGGNNTTNVTMYLLVSTQVPQILQ